MKKLEDLVVNCTFAIHVVDVDTVFLSNSVGSIFSLIQNRWSPSKLCKDDSWCSCESETLWGCHDWEDGTPDFWIFLKSLDTFMSSFCGDFAIDPNVYDLFL